MSENGNGEVQVVKHDFTSSGVAPLSGNAVARTDQTRAVAEVQAAMMIARMNPRDPVAAMDRILNACQRKSLADTAVYTYARGGTNISGPSIRLAEVMAQNWGNVQYGIRELEQRNGESTVQAFAWDVETNTRREVTFQVAHKRHTKSGAYNLTDPRDIYELVANQGARRVRACILGIIPGDVVELAVKQCEETIKAKADTSPANIQKLVESFAEFGVTKEQIEKRIQRRVDAIQPAQVVSLQKIYVSLRDGMSGPEDWFEMVPAEEDGGTSKTDKLRNMMPTTPAQQPAAATAPAEKAKAKPADKSPAKTATLPPIKEIESILVSVYGEDVKRRNEAVADWTQNMCATWTELKSAPDEIVIAALPNARKTAAEYSA